MTQKVSRTNQALALRDAAIVWLRRAGQNEPHPGGYRYLTWRSEEFTLLLRTPFQRVPGFSGKDHRIAAMHGVRLPKQYGYGLDIWRQGSGKVLTLEWEADGTVGLRSFRRGTWEGEIFLLAESVPPQAEAAK